MTRARFAVLVAVLVGTSGCRVAESDAAARKDPEQAVVAKREQRLQEALTRNDSFPSDQTALARWLLPTSLRDISGLALTPDGRLLAHGDAHGWVAEIDYRGGRIVKQFTLAPDVVHADFEGITVVDSMLFMIGSDGKLYEFREGKDGGRVPYVVYDTELGKECEFEGVAFDPSIASLLLACKIVKTPALSDSLVIYRWKLAAGLSRAERLSHVAVSLAQVIGANPWPTVHPSDITIDPANGDYVLIASKDRALIELTPAGAVVSVRGLPGVHDKAEGVAITKDRLLIVSDESVKGPAVITLHRLP